MPSTHHGILLHVVFSTKNRCKVLHSSWRDELYAYVGGIVHEHKAILLQAGGIEDHVHLLIKCHPDFSISNTVKLIKGNSSKWINKQRKIDARFAWQRGYGAFSVSQSAAVKVKQYIADQELHHSKLPFEEEYSLLLSRHGIEFDPRYVFDEEIVA